VIILILIVLGLILGSFVNAVVYRLHIQTRQRKANSSKLKAAKHLSSTKRANKYSIISGRSMCTHCHHELHAIDLVPVFSWLTLGGKCRYCHKSISAQYPVVEILTAALFVISYLYWPTNLGTTIFSQSSSIFYFWLIFLIGLVALNVYDIKWFLLPNKIMYPLLGLALIQSLVLVVSKGGGTHEIWQIVLSFAIGGGLFYLLFQVSGGKWIGGGDVKLGWLLGLILAVPSLTLLMIFAASLLGTFVSLPLMVTKKISRTTHIPFGPFLIAGTIISRLFGAAIINWYRSKLLL
jgi:leader peptidase (prepilin peptidase)/N-methyltransferase